MLVNYQGQQPEIHETSFIAPGAVVTGNVKIGEGSSVWYNAVIRGDVSPVIIGKESNIQDLCCLHQSPNKPLIIEDRVTIGHKVTLHSAIIRNHALIGMDSTVLDGAEIGEYAFIGAGSLVTPGTKIPPRTLAFGRPARVVRELTPEDYQDMERIVQEYADKAQVYKKEHQ
ncbi:gamma carbonic anhydrase family protein [Macrococcus brunensis]|uniref:Gamma carbonic anhydrase family protein n=1 Tax=Macrococcus brunensis TaxID=198483 RepID=A0A4R6BFL1_9STAP|nr:gamma carbonic anhydrase family protein [Macrococcus brunensis]TDL98635.1 gamma carbonic anhydrase family protein [Macrococcus brunensis]ULG71369.1 gamma carbonic anhydrase family protein [Macrococcus brunensis]ULG73676.1 gamma carbonic anhydrase family protein [Macrococcus brunensis]